MTINKPNIETLKNKLTPFFLPCAENNFRARIFAGNFLPFLLIALALLKLGGAVFLYSFQNCSFFADITKTALVDLANAERAKNNLPKLEKNPVLDEAAYLKAQDMAKNGYFSHVSPAGVNPWHWFSQAGYNYRYAGENLAIGFLDSKEVQSAWIASPTHKANIVNQKYQDIGIAVVKANFNGNPATIVVQLFGSKSAKPKEQKTAAGQTAALSTAKDQNLKETAVLGAAIGPAEENYFGFKLAGFLARNFFGFIQFLVYGSLVLVIGLLGVNFALKADFEHIDILTKALGFVLVAAAFALLDQGTIAALLPRAPVIQ